MKIENSFTVDAPIAAAWELLTDIPGIAPCLPGAKLTGTEDGVYSGGIKIKVGPVTSEYKGSATFVEKDDVAYRAVIDGKGRDTRGAGNAQALITAQMTAEGDKTRVDIDTDLKVSGKVAQFGRGVMQDVSTKLLGQFAECLEAKIGEPAAIDQIAAASAGVVSGSVIVEGIAEPAIDGSSNGSESVSAPVADAAPVHAATVGAAASGVGALAAGRARSAVDDGDNIDDEDGGALDLLDAAGDAVFRRIVPFAVVAVIVAFLIIWLVLR